MGHSLGKPKGATVKNDPDLVEKVHRTCQKFQEMVEKAKVQVRMALKKASDPKVFRCYTIYSISLSRYLFNLAFSLSIQSVARVRLLSFLLLLLAIYSISRGQVHLGRQVGRGAGQAGRHGRDAGGGAPQVGEGVEEPGLDGVEEDLLDGQQEGERVPGRDQHASAVGRLQIGDVLNS